MFVFSNFIIMKNHLRRVLAICMALGVLFTTTSFTVDMHFCGKALVDFSLVQNVQTCGMEKEQYKKSCEKGFSENPCCADKQITVDGHDDLKSSFNKFTFEQQTFVVTFFCTYINLFEGFDENVIPFKSYSPPFLIRDVQMLHETYLI